MKTLGLGQMLFLMGLLCLLGSCEGFKVLTIHNSSNADVGIIVKPGISRMQKSEIANFPSEANLMGDSLQIMLLKDSSLVLSSVFTSFLQGAKIRPRDIGVHYLKIETEDAIFLAQSKRDILKLLKDKKFKYQRKIDKEKNLSNSRNFGNIMIRG